MAVGSAKLLPEPCTPSGAIFPVHGLCNSVIWFGVPPGFVEIVTAKARAQHWGSQMAGSVSSWSTIQCWDWNIFFWNYGLLKSLEQTIWPNNRIETSRTDWDWWFSCHRSSPWGPSWFFLLFMASLQAQHRSLRFPGYVQIQHFPFQSRPLKSPPGRRSHLYGFVFGHLSTRQQNARHFETKRKQKLYPRAQHVNPLFGNLSEVLGVCLKFRSLPGIVVSNKCSNSADSCDCFLGMMADDCRSTSK